MLAGEVELWPALAGRAMAMIRPIVRSQVWNQDDWEDVEQDCLLRFFRAVPAYTSRKAPLRVYVGVLARREVVDYCKKAGKQPDLVDIEVLLDAAEEIAAQANPCPDLRTFIEQIVGGEASRAIHLHVFEGYKYAEVGKELGKSEDAAKMQIHRALKELRRHLEDGDA